MSGSIEEVLLEPAGHRLGVIRMQRIASGYHPVVAAPGYAMCYLWALAGESTTLTPSYDPVHAWLAVAPAIEGTA